MIKVYSGKKGLAIFLLFVLGTVLFLSFFLWGIMKIIQVFLPLMIVMSYLLIVIFVFGVLPMTYFKYMRSSLCRYSALMSHALGAATWVMSFFTVIKAFGFFGILFVLAFKFMAPIALAGAIVKGSWHLAGHLAVWISFTYGMRFYSQWLSNLNPQDQEKGHVIDVDAIEVSGH